MYLFLYSVYSVLLYFSFSSSFTPLAISRSTHMSRVLLGFIPVRREFVTFGLVGPEFGVIMEGWMQFSSSLQIRVLMCGGYFLGAP